MNRPCTTARAQSIGSNGRPRSPEMRTLVWARGEPQVRLALGRGGTRRHPATRTTSAGGCTR